MDTESQVETVFAGTILPLTSAAATLARAGGKGANLATLARAGFAVPPGFIVTTDAYRAFVAANEIGARLRELTASVTPDDPASLDSASASIRAMFASGAMPAEIAAQIRAAYDDLARNPVPHPGPLAEGDGISYPPVAVRSSATAEDLPGLSFAGQQDTYLNVIGPDDLIDAVKSCWGSLWTARAIGYRARNNISGDDVALAVVVQQMIPAEVSGVIFTANPLTGHRGEMVIDASFGLGEAIVSGQVEPDHYVVSAAVGVQGAPPPPLPSRETLHLPPLPSRETLHLPPLPSRERAGVRVVPGRNHQQFSITSRKLGAKALAIRPRREGGTEPIAEDRSGQQALSDPQILELTDVAARIADLFGSPQDIEWAYAPGSVETQHAASLPAGAGSLHILQSRPITSLYPLPEWLVASKDLRVLFSLNSLQGFVEPFTPLGLDILRLMVTGILRRVGVRRPIERVAVAAGGRLFVDMTTLFGDRRLRRLALGFLGFADPGAREAALGLITAGRISTAANLGKRDLLRLIVALRPILWGVLMGWLRPKAMRRRSIQKADAYVAEFRQAMARASVARVQGAAPSAGVLGVSPGNYQELLITCLQARLAVIDRYIPDLLLQLFLTVAPAMAPAMMAMTLVNTWLVNWAGLERGAGQRLMRGVPGNPTTEMDLKLWAAAEAIRADPASRAAFVETRDLASLQTPMAALSSVETRHVASLQGADEIADAYQPGELPAVAQRALGAFLEEYGMRGIGEIDVGRPRWREDPRSIIQNLASFLQVGDPEMAPDRLYAKARAEAEQLAAESVARVRQRQGRLRAFLVGFTIRRLRLLGGMREMPKFYMVKAFDVVRTALLDSGRELADLGELDRAEDIFFVPLDILRTFATLTPALSQRERGEWTASPSGRGRRSPSEGRTTPSEGPRIDLKAIVNRERAEYERELARRQMPRLLLSTGEAFYAGLAASGANDLVGDGVSPGTVEGLVRVVLDPRGARLEPGEILVCPATDPGWTPLFLSAGGLVMELGGMMTHGSVVAREYGIPAVVGVHDATRRLKTGQRVRVDGSAGRVVLLDGTHPASSP